MTGVGRFSSLLLDEMGRSVASTTETGCFVKSTNGYIQFLLEVALSGGLDALPNVASDCSVVAEASLDILVNGVVDAAISCVTEYQSAYGFVADGLIAAEAVGGGFRISNHVRSFSV